MTFASSRKHIQHDSTKREYSWINNTVSHLKWTEFSEKSQRKHVIYITLWHADVAQLVEQRFCKPQAVGSIPIVGCCSRQSGTDI